MSDPGPRVDPARSVTTVSMQCTEAMAMEERPASRDRDARQNERFLNHERPSYNDEDIPLPTVKDRTGFCFAICISLGLLLSAIPAAMIAVGIIFREECPREHRVPLYLIIMGGVSLVAVVCGIAQVVAFCKGRALGTHTFRAVTIIAVVVYTGLMVIFIVGNVWIYGMYNHYTPVKPSDIPVGTSPSDVYTVPTFTQTSIATDSTATFNSTETPFASTEVPLEYCDKTLYEFAFWVTTATYITMAAGLILSICGLLFFYCCLTLVCSTH